MANGGSIQESLWRDLIADEVEHWLSITGHDVAFQDDDLVEFIRTGNEKENN